MVGVTVGVGVLLPHAIAIAGRPANGFVNPVLPEQ